MSRGDYSIKEFTELAGKTALEAAREKFTGQITLTLHLRDGGIGRIEELRMRDLRRQPDPAQDNAGSGVSALERRARENGGIVLEQGI